MIDRMIEEGHQPTLYSLSKLIGSFEQRGQIEKAIQLHAVTRKHNIVFDAVTFNSMIVAFGKSGRLDRALEVHHTTPHHTTPHHTLQGTHINFVLPVKGV